VDGGHELNSIVPIKEHGLGVVGKTRQPLKFCGKLLDHKCEFVVDCGSTDEFVGQSFVEKNGLV